MPADRLSAGDPATTLSGLLHIISAGLGGDLVVWARVDNSTGLVTVIDLVDPATAVSRTAWPWPAMHRRTPLTQSHQPARR